MHTAINVLVTTNCPQESADAGIWGNNQLEELKESRSFCGWDRHAGLGYRVSIQNVDHSFPITYAD